MEQMCSYCDKFFVVPPDEHGVLDMCPDCYAEYAPWMDGTAQEVQEAWGIFERKKLDEGIEASLLESVFKAWRSEYKKRFGMYPQL